MLAFMLMRTEVVVVFAIVELTELDLIPSCRLLRANASVMNSRVTSSKSPEETTSRVFAWSRCGNLDCPAQTFVHDVPIASHAALF